MREQLVILRDRLAGLSRNACGPQEAECFGLGAAEVDGVLGGGLARGALHEIFASRLADAGAASGFAAALARRAAGRRRALVWVRQSFAGGEIGRLYAPGLAGLGCDPGAVILVELRDGLAVLRAGLEAARCDALAGVVIEPWGEPKSLDFTATRRLALAATGSGVTVFLLRLGAAPGPSAARTRWRVAAGPSRPLAADAPGLPSFDVTLLRHRAGVAGHGWRLEWDHEQLVFRIAACPAPLSRPVVSVPAGRPAAPPRAPGGAPAPVIAIAR